MSVFTFVDQLTGLAREYKRHEKRLARRGHAAPPFGGDIANRMIDTGYFEPGTAKVFGDILETVLQASTPQYKKKE